MTFGRKLYIILDGTFIPFFYAPSKKVIKIELLIYIEIIITYRRNKVMRTTFMANAQNVQRKWYVVDADGKTLGRLSSEIATLLRGKHKPTYTPHVECGDNVIVINAEKIVLTGNKWNQKMYYRHSMHPGGLKSKTAKTMNQTHPERMIEFAVKGMIPHNRLGSKVNKNLFVYSGSEHPHAAQQPEVYELRG